MPPKKNLANVEGSSRTLRPRAVSAQPASKIPVEAKPKKTPTSKKVSATNGLTSKEKQQSSKVKRKAVEKKSGDGEPEPKLNKVEAEGAENSDEHVSASSVFEFKAKTIEGKEISLSKYKGHVCIIVNVASRCGHTSSNYKEFVELYDKYSKNKGLRILAFPCNQFGKQEPGDNDKICEFAKKKNVSFDMFEKIDVNGKNAHPLWKYLTSQKEGPKGAKIDWNFTKFLISKDGQVVDRFKPSVKPLALMKELEKLW